MRLTDISVRALDPPQSGQRTYFDDTLPGFGIRVSQGGTKTFVLMHGRGRRLTTIGRVGIVSLKEAREKAKVILAERVLGKKELPNITFEKALTIFLSDLEKRVKPSTYKTDKRLLEKYFLPTFRHDKVHAISKNDVQSVLEKLDHVPGEQVHLFGCIRKFCRWSARRGYVERPATEWMQARKRSPRTRILSDDELKAVLKSCIARDGVSERFTTIVLLLLLTGQRVNQIASLRGEWVDREVRTITFPPSVMKGNREHLLPCCHWAFGLLRDLPETGLLFPARGRNTKFNGFSTCMDQFRRACGIKDWTLHDLRRTLRTGLARLRVPREIGERILDHRSGAATDVELIYDRHLYLEEMQEALTKWEWRVSRLLAEAANPPPGSLQRPLADVLLRVP